MKPSVVSYDIGLQYERIVINLELYDEASRINFDLFCYISMNAVSVSRIAIYQD